MELTLNGRDNRDQLLARTGGSGDRRVRQAPADVVAERFRTAYHGSPAGLALLSPSGSVSHANPALCGFLGMTADEVIGTDLADWFDPEGKASRTGGTRLDRSGRRRPAVVRGRARFRSSADLERGHDDCRSLSRP